MVNLGTARRLVEKWATDSCRVERDREGVHDDVLELATMRLLKRPLEPLVVYDGPCLVSPTGIGQTVEGARVVERRGYRITLPHDAGTFFQGDRVLVLQSADPELEGRQLVLIDSSQGATMDVRCVLNAQDVDAVAAQ